MKNSMSAAHTPGPWFVSRDDDTTLTIVAPWSQKVAPGKSSGWGDYRGIHVATLTHHRDPDATVPPAHAEANARLIASAPELLDAVERLLVCMRLAGWEGDDSAIFARAAIARATGATS